MGHNTQIIISLKLIFCQTQKSIELQTFRNLFFVIIKIKSKHFNYSILKVNILKFKRFCFELKKKLIWLIHILFYIKLIHESGGEDKKLFIFFV